MAIDGVNTKMPVYTPVRPKGRSKLDIDNVLPTDEIPKSSDEETPEHRERKPSDDKPPTGSDESVQGKIDERI